MFVHDFFRTDIGAHKFSFGGPRRSNKPNLNKVRKARHGAHTYITASTCRNVLFDANAFPRELIVTTTTTLYCNTI